MTKIKYALYPGYVWSKTDGGRHYVSAITLAELYRVNFGECIVIRRGRQTRLHLIHLYPSYRGDYSLPKELR